MTSIITTRIATSLADLSDGWAIVAQKLPSGRSLRREWSYTVDQGPFRMAVAAGAVVTAQRYDGETPVLLAKMVAHG